MRFWRLNLLHKDSENRVLTVLYLLMVISPLLFWIGYVHAKQDREIKELKQKLQKSAEVMEYLLTGENDNF